MFNMNDYNNATPVSFGGGHSLPGGAYECVIKAVEDKTSKNGNDMLVVDFDIAGGEYAQYAVDTAERAGFWPLTNWMTYGGSYTTKKGNVIENMGKFKAEMERIESANSGWRFNGPKSLIGRRFYATIREEEYTKQSGGIGTRNKIDVILSAEDYAAGKFNVPETKRVEQAAPSYTAPSFADSDDDGGDLPF